MSSVIIKTDLSHREERDLVHSLRTTAIISTYWADASVNYLGLGWDRLEPSPGTSRLVLTSFSWWQQKLKRSSGDQLFKDLPYYIGQSQSHDRTQSQGTKNIFHFFSKENCKVQAKSKNTGNGKEWEPMMQSIHMSWMKQSDPLQATATARKKGRCLD